MKSKELWSPPVWMLPYLPFVVNTGGNDVREMMIGNADPRINLPLSTLQACVKSQVAFMEALHRIGLLGDALTIKRLEEACGYVEDGSHTTVTISQDDATRSWVVKVGRRSFYGNSLREALKTAGEG